VIRIAAKGAITGILFLVIGPNADFPPCSAVLIGRAVPSIPGVNGTVSWPKYDSFVI
jgi:hypothetical protein